MNYTKSTLQKLEELFDELGYIVRYEKGNFQSGYAILELKKIAVVNKFFETEARINALLDIFDQIEAKQKAVEIVESMSSEIPTNNDNWEKNLSEKSMKLVKQIRNHRNKNEQDKENQ